MTQTATGAGLLQFHYDKPVIEDKPKVVVPLARSSTFNFHMQVAHDGGETNLHAHAAMESMWLVLKGRIRFYDGDESKFGEYGPLEGIHIPRAAPYWFESVGDEDLEVMHIMAMNPGANNTRLNFKPLRAWQAGEVLEEKVVDLEKHDAKPMSSVRYESPELGSNIKVTYILKEEDMLAVSVEKVRNGGGDDGLHTHTGTDSVWFVMSGGRVRFRTPEGEEMILDEHDGLYVPRGAAYGFSALDDEPAEVLHVKARDVTVANERIDY
jgi:mannose-6-phosphate isomerase-like protein (cupin superfamily)